MKLGCPKQKEFVGYSINKKWYPCYNFRYLCIFSVDFFVANTWALALPQPRVIIDILVMVGFNQNIVVVSKMIHIEHMVHMEYIAIKFK